MQEATPTTHILLTLRLWCVHTGLKHGTTKHQAALAPRQRRDVHIKSGSSEMREEGARGTTQRIFISQMGRGCQQRGWGSKEGTTAEEQPIRPTIMLECQDTGLMVPECLRLQGADNIYLFDTYTPHQPGLICSALAALVTTVTLGQSPARRARSSYKAKTPAAQRLLTRIRIIVQHTIKIAFSKGYHYTKLAAQRRA